MEKRTTLVRGGGGDGRDVQVANYDYDKRLAVLTPEEKSKYLQMTDSIKDSDVTTVKNFGSELDAVISDNANTLLRVSRDYRNNDVNNLILELNSQMELVNIEDINNDSTWRRFVSRIPFANRIIRSAKNVIAKYDTVADNVDKIAKKLDASNMLILKDDTTIDELYANTKSYIKDVREEIIALKVRIEEEKRLLVEMEQNSDIEQYEIEDKRAFVKTLEKHTHNKVVKEYVLTLDMFQLRAAKGNNEVLSDTTQEMINLIPTWREELAIGLIINNQKASAEVNQMVKETTNKMLIKNAENLKESSIMIAKMNEEPIIQMETLKKTTQALKDAVETVRSIHEQGEANMELMETAIKGYHNDIVNALTIK